MTVIPPPGSPAEHAATEAFACHRELLFSVVYSMLGGITDTEDVLHETWLEWARRRPEPGRGADRRPRAWLLRTAVRRALAGEDAVARRRAAYLGPWLPEPLVSPLDAETGAERGPASGHVAPVPVAMLVRLAGLAPLERAVFVLSEVAGCGREEIAQIVGRAPAAVGELARRARASTEGDQPRHQADPRVRQRIIARFGAAMLGGDLAAFERLLAPEVTIQTDSGGKAPAAGPCGVHRRDQAARLLAAGGYQPRAGAEVRCRRVNGEPSLVVTDAGVPFTVLVLEVEPDGARVCGIYAVTNPDKLARAG